MGIDYSGGMIVGASGDELSVPEDYVSEYTPDEELALYEWAEEVGLDSFSKWYDAGDDGKVYGFTIQSRWRESELDELMKEVKQKMLEFKELTGVEAMLIGMQDIY